MNTTTNRETWLNQLAQRMAPRFEELGYPLPAFRVSTGFTSGGKSSKANGEAWHKSRSADGHYEIFITPDVADPLEAAAILGHELNHTASGFKHKHKGLFATNMVKLGYVRPFTSSVPGDAFKAWVQPFLEELGALPHAPLMFRSLMNGGAGGAGEGEGDEDGGSSNEKKKQSTRMLKAACSHQVDGKACGYTVRLTKKWAKELGACCPAHGPMEVDGLEAEGEDDGEGEDE